MFATAMLWDITFTVQPSFTAVTTEIEIEINMPFGITGHYPADMQSQRKSL